MSDERTRRESVGGFVSGARRRGSWDFGRVGLNAKGDGDEPQTIFVDGLVAGITKRMLYVKFGKFKYILDVFISRKMRAKAIGSYAFIRYKNRRGAEDAIRMLNGTMWENNNLVVTIPKFERSGASMEKSRIKEVKGVWAEEQKERLKRSLMGCSSKPIEFRNVMNLLLDEWKGPGDIEVRDIGPYRCLITFTTSETRDIALEDELLLSVFDELRPHWDIFWCHSRRVWIAITGMPVCMWCSKNFEVIVKLWGKPIKWDDRGAESKSYTTCRIQIECYQWEMINEWVSIKIDDRVFEVFVKEFGPKLYSVESHPDRLEGYFDSGEGRSEEAVFEE
ncbi:hypothetical protein PIB30_053837 [Stylosanthes scabra]|uniref:RRM domain-containing protein n=1 Tax=Stylosanthes scabra TaxID=79078 RepID=A0ABU6UK52_9FABA|nr:hypothetical protein [Stylosanthes scabra]